jgi:soluble lytic murein transglycosylase
MGALPAVASAPTYWLQPTPRDAAEAALRDALAKNGFTGGAAMATALQSVAEAQKGTVTAGLARLAAGLALQDAGHSAEAIPFLRHPDVARTSLPDYALAGLAEALDAVNDKAAAATYIAAADARPEGPVACGALFRAAETLVKAADHAKALETLGRVQTACPDQQSRALLETGAAYEGLRDAKAAAETYDRLDRDFPASPQAKEATKRLARLATALPAMTDEARDARELKKALALFDADNIPDAMSALRSVRGRKLAPTDMDLVRTRLGRGYLSLKHYHEAEVELAGVATESPSGAEAAFFRAKIANQTRGTVDLYEGVAALFPGTPWGEEALLALANHYQKDARDDEALPYFRRLLEGYPAGRYADRAAWRVGWGEYRQGRFEEAAREFEKAARLQPTGNFTPGMLYWAGRARKELGQIDRAQQLLVETVQRYKRVYHGLRAEETLARLPKRAASPQAPAIRAPADAPAGDIPEPYLTRARQLLLIDRLDAAYDELKGAPQSPLSQGTLAWIEWRRGHLRPAITAMKRAYPEYLSEAGDTLPDDVWRVMYPIQYSEVLQAKAASEGLDPALVAALVCQESTFDAGAISRTGARGLMQVMPPTGRTLARALRVRYSAGALHDPNVSLTFGTHYLRTLIDHFGGRVERALAAYNAGPERVEAWTADKPDMPADEFVERIPFTETRLYVMVVLGGREQYRRIYNLAPAPKAADLGAARP